MAIYFYLAKIKVDARIWLKCFGLSVFYNLLFWKPRDIKTYNAVFIKQ